MKIVERQKRAKTISIPTYDKDVKFHLRELRQPICLFGEDPFLRRERLREVVTKIYIDEGRLPSFKKIPKIEEREEVKVSEIFYTRGTEKLKQVRNDIAKYSIPRSTMRFLINRIEQSKKQRIDQKNEEKPLQDDIINNKFSSFEVIKTQFADERCASKITFSPDDKLIATSGWSSISKIWSIFYSDIETCQPITSLEGHKGKVFYICFHPQSQISTSLPLLILATAGEDASLRIWKIDPEASINQSSIDFLGHEERINYCKFHPSGFYVASSSHDSTWRLWDLETRTELLIQEGHKDPVFPISFQNDGALLASGDLQGIGLVWDLRSGKNIMSLQGHVKRILSIEFHPNCYQIASGSDDNTVRIWDMRKRDCLYVIPAHNKLISDIKFDENGKFMTTASYDYSWKIWNTSDYREISCNKGHENKLSGIAFNKDYTTFVTSSFDKTFKIWKPIPKVN